MRILERTVFVGANVYAHYPVIRLRIDLGQLEEWPSRRLGERFIEPLLGALPGLATHGCSYSTPGGFVRRLREDEGTWMGHILEHVTLELQHLAGANVSFGKTRSTGRPGEYDLVYAYEDEAVGVRAAEVAERLLRTIIPEELHGGAAEAAFDLPAELAELVTLAVRNAGADGTPRNGKGDGAVVVVAGDDGASQAVQLLAGRLAAAGRSVAVADGIGARRERELVRAGHELTIIGTSRLLLLDGGLGILRCDAAAVLGPLHGRRDPLRLPLEIADRCSHLVDSSPAAAAVRIAALLD